VTLGIVKNTCPYLSIEIDPPTPTIFPVCGIGKCPLNATKSGHLRIAVSHPHVGPDGGVDGGGIIGGPGGGANGVAVGRGGSIIGLYGGRGGSPGPVGGFDGVSVHFPCTQ
jgi:hypothetical protein